MIPIDLSEAHKAYFDQKINMWELKFLEEVHKEDFLSEKQYELICNLATRMLPHILIIKVQIDITYGSPYDPYFDQRYYPDPYDH